MKSEKAREQGTERGSEGGREEGARQAGRQAGRQSLGRAPEPGRQVNRAAVCWEGGRMGDPRTGEFD